MLAFPSISCPQRSLALHSIPQEQDGFVRLACPASLSCSSFGLGFILCFACLLRADVLRWCDFGRRCKRGGVREEPRERVGLEMGAIGGDELVEWDRMAGPEAVNGGGGAGKLHRIQVLVRLRPLSENEIAWGEPAEWECINDTTVMFRSTFPDRPTAPTAYTFG
jgi:hypothetical protein